jgi:hypothetical protein
MLRIRAAGTLVLVVVLLAAACGGSTTTSTVDEPEATAVADAYPASTTSAAPEEPADAAGAAASSDTDDAAEEASGDPDDIVPDEDSDDIAPTDAAALLASATTQLEGRSVRGEAAIEFVPGFELLSSFEADTDGDLATVINFPPGLDAEFPAGGDSEVRYVGGVTYVRPPASAETLAELGVDEAWYIAELAAAGDPMSQAAGPAGGVLCVFPLQSMDEPAADCDPLGETGAFLAAAGEPEIVGQEDVRGVEATRVRLLVSLRDLAGDALGIGPDDGADADPSEVGAFDDTASDPFAEGVAQILGFLDAEFEVEVWIDGDSLIRRLSFDLASLFAGMAGGEVEMPSSLISLEFYDFDADISIDAPAAEAIVDVSLIRDVAGSGLGG